ncbi:MAG: hypothetical protein P8170_13735 [Gemmatimonadota bacterium]
MFYVPIVPTPPTPPSPRTRELADLLSRVIHEYESHHPSVSGAEVRLALRLAAQSSRKGAQAASTRVALAAGLALFVAAGVAYLALASGGGLGASESFPMVAAVLVGIVLIAVLAAVKASRGP